jgi:hypothetical protein
VSLIPFAMPGSDIFKKDESPKKGLDEIFQKPAGGGGGGAGAAAAKQKAEEEAKKQLEQESEDYFKSNDKVRDPEPPPKPVVVLSHPKWGGEQGIFGQKIKASVEGVIPKEIEHRTKVTFTVFALPPNGEWDRIDSKEGHIRNGIAEVEIDLWRPHVKLSNGDSLVSCPYIFTVKHSCSKEVTSERIQITETKSFRKLYEARLKEAVEKLKGVGFGRAEEKFDEEDWVLDWERGHSPTDPGGPVVKIGQLNLIAGKSYPDAIIKVIENPGKWSFDCFQFFQICNLYALIDPDNKELFEKSIENILNSPSVTEKKTRAIRTFASQVQVPYESTGLGLKKAYFRMAPNGKWICPPLSTPQPIDIDSLIAQAPIGSRVAWTNTDMAATSGARVENALKIGQNLYWVNGLFPENPRKATREEIEAKHALYSNPKPDKNYIKNHIFISDFATFNTPET